MGSKTTAMGALKGSTSGARKDSPVFVVGCHRSGTNLLYDTLLSAGGFAIYRGYLPVHKMLIPRFGSMGSAKSRQRILQAWLRSKGFRRAGIDAANISEKILMGARHGGDFIRIVMDEIASEQNVPRWAVYDPDDVLFLRRIHAEIPNALFVHIIRDGRDIAVSLRKMGEFRPVPWNRKPASLAATALYWRWIVKTGRSQGKTIPENYTEVRYEDLVRNPQETLAGLGNFLEHDLNFDRIRSANLGRLSESNSSFRDTQEEQASPVNRWKEKLSSVEVADLESLVGDCLEECGYALTTSEQQRKLILKRRILRGFYARFLGFKFWLKTRTRAGRMTNLSALELSDAGTAEDEK